jgi:cephalosporin hydroxylase
MNPLSTVSPSSLVDSPQRLDGSRPSDPAIGSAAAREQQAARAEQPRSEVSVSISSAARERAASELPSTQTVDGSKAAAALAAETRRSETEPPPALGQRIDVRA